MGGSPAGRWSCEDPLFKKENRIESVPTGGGRSSVEAEAGGLKQAIVIDEYLVFGHLDEVMRSTVEQTFNQLLGEEAGRLTGAAKCERSAGRKQTRAGSYLRKLQTKAGEVALTVQRLRKLPLETAIFERYKR